eukprot:355172-Chlamydomonas_euryale.AAC.4
MQGQHPPATALCNCPTFLALACSPFAHTDRACLRLSPTLTAFVCAFHPHRPRLFASFAHTDRACLHLLPTPKAFVCAISPCQRALPSVRLNLVYPLPLAPRLNLVYPLPLAPRLCWRCACRLF